MPQILTLTAMSCGQRAAARAECRGAGDATIGTDEAEVGLMREFSEGVLIRLRSEGMPVDRVGLHSRDLSRRERGGCQRWFDLSAVAFGTAARGLGFGDGVGETPEGG